MKNETQPCAEMTIVTAKNEFVDNWGNMNNSITRNLGINEGIPPGLGSVSILIKYPHKTYHEIVNVRMVTFDSLWANAGGFIGMFLGYSAMQVPQFLLSIAQWSMKNKN